MKFGPKSADKLIEAYGADNISLIRTASGASDGSFASRYLPQLRRFAEYVQELPLDPEEFNQPLGAFRFGVTSAFLALRLSDQAIFVSGHSHERRILDPQYRYAAYCACLATTIVLAHHNLIITLGGKPWSYLAEQPNLYQAASLAGSYEVGWTRNLRKPSPQIGVVVLGQFFELGAWAEFSESVTSDMCSSINPSCTQVPGETPLAKVVRQGLEKARELEMKGRAGQYRPPPETASMPLSSIDSGSLELEPVGSEETRKSDAEMPPRKASLTRELQAWASFIRANAELQKKLTLEPDGTMRFEAAHLSGAGLRAQEVYDWLRNGGFIVAQNKEPTKHLVLSSTLARELKVES